MKIFLNPGHDRQLDSGAVNPVSGLREADVVYDVTVNIINSVQELLENKGIETRSLQANYLGEICDAANSWDADYFISVHCNGFNTVAHGTEVEVYNFGGTSDTLAQCVQKQIVKNLGTVDRGVRERPGLYVLKNTDMPAILIEMAFIDNEDDAYLLENKKDVFARSIANGIFEFLNIPTEDYNDENLIAPNGIPYEENDIQYLINQGYSRGDAISFLATSDKYSNSDMQKAAEYANSRVNSQGYGNNGCTAWVKDFLLHANHWFGQVMADGSQGNLMWVPNIMAYAKECGIWKDASEGGALGDICLLETNNDWDDGPDHVVIACGDGNYWGNSSSRNRIVKSSIAYDYGEDAIWGYVATGSGNSKVVTGAAQRSKDEIVGDAGTTSGVVHNLSPNGKVYEQNDINYLLNLGYTREAAIEALSLSPKYNDDLKIRTAPNGKIYEQNDIDYLIKNGYTLDSAIAFLSTADKYVQ